MAEQMRPLPEWVREGLIKTKQGYWMLKAAWRLAWFRTENPTHGIKTELIRLNDDACVMKAEILDTENRVLATGHKSVTAESFKHGFIEKAESGAVNRALVMLGYATPDEDQEGEQNPPTRRASNAGQQGSTAKCPICSVRPATPGSHHRRDCAHYEA